MLVIDNDSGTYGPPSDHLPFLGAVLEAAFPDLVVYALDRKDPTLQAEKQKIKEEAAAAAKK